MSSHLDPVPRLELHGGSRIPQLGFGVFQIPRAETELAVARALEAGYRHIDTAAAYRNEGEVGLAVRSSGLERGDLFITTKCWNEDQGYEESRRALHGSLSRLEMDHVDLYLIHWPVPSHDRYVETWRAFIEMRDEGLIRTIGVSNFQPAHLERLVKETGEVPAINQIELHPYLQQPGLRREHQELGILTEAWSPLARGLVLDDPVITEIARAHVRTPGQVVIRWQIQIGNVVIPKSVTPARITENFQVYDFELTAPQMQAIGELDAGRRTGPDPDEFVRP